MPGGRSVIRFNCLDCGRVTERVRRHREPMICIDCGIARALAYNDRLRAERLARRDVRGIAGTPQNRAD